MTPENKTKLAVLDFESEQLSREFNRLIRIRDSVQDLIDENRKRSLECQKEQLAVLKA